MGNEIAMRAPGNDSNPYTRFAQCGQCLVQHQLLTRAWSTQYLHIPSMTPSAGACGGGCTLVACTSGACWRLDITGLHLGSVIFRRHRLHGRRTNNHGFFKVFGATTGGCIFSGFADIFQLVFTYLDLVTVLEHALLDRFTVGQCPVAAVEVFQKKSLPILTITACSPLTARLSIWISLLARRPMVMRSLSSIKSPRTAPSNE